jgi:tyrosyl-tRNA synthetase
MALKQHLARAIVQDFHGEDASRRAEQDWSTQVQRKEAPDSIAVVEVRYADISAGALDGMVRLDKLLFIAGLASSATDGKRKRGQNAVRINGELSTEAIIVLRVPVVLDIRVGNKMKRVHVLPNNS